VPILGLLILISLKERWDKLNSSMYRELVHYQSNKEQTFVSPNKDFNQIIKALSRVFQEK